MAVDARTKVKRLDSVPPPSASRFDARTRVLVIDDSSVSRARLADLLGGAGFVPYEQPSAIGATRLLLSHAISAVVIDLGVLGLSGEKLVGLLRKNPRLDGLVIVVVISEEHSRQLLSQGLRDVDAVVFRDRLEAQLVQVLQRLLCTSGFHQKAPVFSQ